MEKRPGLKSGGDLLFGSSQTYRLLSVGTGAQLIKIIGPCLHHLATFSEIFGAIIRRASPSVAWIQSFADERCGRLGVVYQASNFLYLGSHVATFYFLDGDYYHKLLLTAHLKTNGKGRMLRENAGRALKLTYRQYRYVLFLKQSWRKRLRLKVQPYPKPEA